MKVKLNVAVCGHTETGLAWGAGKGDVIEMTDKEARAYIERGYATAEREPKNSRE